MTKRTTEDGLVVVVGVDFSEGAAEALREAVRLSAQGAVRQIHAVHVFEADEREARKRPDEAERAMEEAAERLRRFVGQFGTSPQAAPAHAPPKVGVHLRVGSPAEQIHRLAANVDADLILIGPHRGALRSLSRPLGGTARHILERARCSVAIARIKHYEPDERQPEIEPPCPDCLRVRAESGGERWWCPAHERPRLEPHRYTAWEAIPWAEHDSNVLPTGFHVPRWI